MSGISFKVQKVINVLKQKEVRKDALISLCQTGEKLIRLGLILNNSAAVSRSSFVISLGGR